MVTGELIFDGAAESDVDSVEGLLAAWWKNGQIEGHSWKTAFSSGGLRVFASLATPLALDPINDNVYATQALEELSTKGISRPEVRILGTDPESLNSCRCSQRSSLILFTHYLSRASPVRCGDCFDLVPLYTLPHTHDHEHLNLLQWAADYRACDTLQLHCTTGERFGERQLYRHDSSLSKQGRKIASLLSDRLGLPVYYFLMKARGRTMSVERRRVCPSCRQPWLLPSPWHRLFEFRCDSCRLVSNIPSSLS
jgi:predicted  nucleic acid-binding Zn ribbon protein